MDILRKFISVILFLIIGLLLGIAGVLFILSIALSPAQVKKTIASDNGYQKIDQAIKNYFNSPSASLEDAQTAQFINQNINSQFLQDKMELVIDKYYAWVRGDQTEMKVSLGNLIDTSQIAVQLQAQGIEVPTEELAKMQDVALPIPESSTRNQLKIFYDLIFGGYLYLLEVTGVLVVILMLLRFNLKDRLFYLFEIVLWPTASFLISYLCFYGFKHYYLKNDSLFSGLSDSYRALAFDKTKSIVDTILLGHLQLIIVGVTATVITLIGYLTALHYYKKLHPDTIKTQGPVTTTIVTGETKPAIEASKVEEASSVANAENPKEETPKAEAKPAEEKVQAKTEKKE